MNNSNADDLSRNSDVSGHQRVDPQAVSLASQDRNDLLDRI